MKALLIGNILNQIWAIDQGYAQGQLPMLINMIEGKISNEDFSSKRAALRSYTYNVDSKSTGTFKDVAPGSVAIINLSGPLMKNDQWCGPEGTATVLGYLKEANANPNIKAIVLNIDSPGGTVDGTESFANEIKNASKPVVAYVDGMAASAAYWIASACSLIVLNGETAVLGSIGTMCSFLDFLPALEAQGVKYHEIYAQGSTNKNIEWQEALKGNYKPMQENVLNPINKVFTQAVEKNRGAKLDSTNTDVLSGSVFHGTKAIKLGLGDEIGNLEYAANRAIQLADKSTNDKNKKSESMKVQIKSSWKGIMSFLNLKAEEGKPVIDKDLSEAELEGMNAKMEGFDALKLEADAAKASVADLTTKLNDATAEVTSLKEENTTLKASGTKTKEPVKKVKETAAVENNDGTKKKFVSKMTLAILEAKKDAGEVFPEDEEAQA